MNNNIRDKYCSGEVVNLLLKHGFNVECDTPVPTHAVAIEWIFMNFGVWIYSRPLVVDKKVIWRGIYLSPDRNTEGSVTVNSSLFFNSSQEATEAALRHVLENLTK